MSPTCLKRLKFEEFYITQIALSLLRNKTEYTKNGINFERVDMRSILKLFPYEIYYNYQQLQKYYL